MPAAKSLAARLLTRVFGRPTAPLRRNPLGRRLEEFEERVVPAGHVWSRAFGDTGIDTGTAVAADAFGNTYVAGYFEGTANFGLGGVTAAGATDGYVAKYDPVGNLAWVRTYGGTGASVFPSGVALDGAGNVVVVGSHTQTVNFGAGPHNAGVTQDIFLVKLDADGGDVSATSFTGTGFEFVRSMAIDGAGSVVLTGTFDGTVDFGLGTLTKSGVINGSTDIFLAKFDAAGNTVFSKRFGDDLSQAGNGVGVDAAGNIILGGNGGGGADFGGGPLPAGLFLVKFDPLGNHLLSRSILASSVADVAVEPDGTAYFAGSFGGTVDFGNGQVVMSAGGNQFYLLKTDPSLATVFARGYGDAANQSVAAVAADGLGHVALTGAFEGSIDFGNGGVVLSGGGNDLYYAVLDADGNHIVSAGYGGADIQGGQGVALDGSRRLNLAGAFRTAINAGGTTFNSNGDFDALVAKYSFAAGTTAATLAGGNLTLTDTADQSDAYTVSVSGPDLVIFSPTATFEGAAGAISPDGHTLTLPLFAVAGVLQFDAAGGDDTLTLDLSGGNPIPAGGVQFNGGAGGNDRLVLQGGSVQSQTFNFVNATDGSVQLNGVLSSVGTVAYTGLDPITSTLSSEEVVLNYSPASEAITIRQFPGDATRTEAVSTAAESVDFVNPTVRLEVNGGGGDDDVAVDGFGTGGGGFAAELDIDGEGGTDSVTVNTPLTLSAAGASLTLAAGAIILNGGTVATAGLQTYAGDVVLGATTTMTATGVLFGGAVDLNVFDLTVDQSVDTNVGGTISGAGGLTKAGAGSLRLDGNNSYSGDTVVDGGRLFVTGTITSDVTVNAAGTLGGTGFVVGNVGGTGTFAPGLSPGALAIVGNFTPAGTLAFEANPPLVNGGIDFDVFLVQGAVDLSGATLTFTGTALFEDPNAVATLIDNDGTDLTTAAASPADGATVVIDGIAYRLFYNGGDGNDVVLIEASSPTTIYVDDDFTASRGQVIADADLGRASQQPAIFGVNAFTTIGEAVAAAPPGGKIVVNGGTYAEAVVLAGPTAAELEVTGDDAAQLVTIDSLATDTFRTVSIRGASVLAVGDATDTTIASSLGGTGTLVKQGTGTLTLSEASFGFDGEISVTAGTLRVTADDALGSTAGGTTVDVGATLLFDNVTYGSPFFATEAVALGGTVAGAGLSEFNGPITLTNTVFVNVPAAADVLVLAGDIDESAPGSGLLKTGDGTAVLGGFFGAVNTFTGQTVVLAGTLEVNAEQLGSDAVVVDGRLAGDFGVVGSLTAAGGTVDPGEATNTFTGSLGVDGDAILTSAATFHAFLCECESSDTLVVRGAVTLGDAALTLTADPFFEPVFGDYFVIVDNDGVDPVVGTFAGLPEGEIVTVGGFQLQISYAGDTGNDVVLTLVPDLAVGDATVTEGDAGTVLLTFTLTLSAASSVPISVDYATADDTAAAAAGDYAAAAGTVLFLPGQTTRTVSIVVNGDRIDEADETLVLNLSGPVNARVTDGQGVGTITDDDGAPSVSIAGGSVAEGNTGTAAVTFTVTLSNPSSTPVTVAFATADGTAQAASDYTAAIGTVTFAPGQTSQTITVNATGDTTFESDETFTVTLAAPTGATIGTGTGTIVNDDAAPVISVNDATVTEGDAGAVTMTFTVSLSNASSTPVTVGFATAGVTAQPGADFTPAAGTVTFAPGGPLTQTVTVLVTGDTADEPDETLALNLSAAAGGSIGDGQGVGTILDDDGIPAVSVAGTTVAEGTGGLTAVTFTVTLSNPSGTPVTVNYATADGTATTADGDYTPAAGSLLFTPGETTKTVTVFAAADARFEPDETVTLALSAPFGATLGTAAAAATLTNDDAPPVVSVAGAAVAEGNAGTTPLTFTVTLSAASGLPVTVSFATADGTAVAPGDYTATSGTVTFAPGQTSQTVTVSVIDDGTFEADETFTLTLSAPTGATIGAGTATGTVVNDDALPVVSVSDAAAAEGNAGTTPLTFTVTLSNPSSQTVTVTFATADGTAQAGSDYTATSGTVTFAPGQTSQTVTVNATGDTTFEPTEDFALHLTAAAGGTLGDDQGVGTITNDDAVPVVSIDSPTIAEGNSGSAPLTFTVSLSNPSSSPVTVTYSMTDGTASAGSDFTPAAGTLTFAPGETTKPLPVPVLGDLAHEADETFTVTLAGPTNATLGTATGTGTILNDDPVPVASVVGGSVVEGNTGTTPFDFVVTLSNPSGQVVSIQYTTLDNSAGPGDYQPTSGSVVFAPGETSKTVTVNVVGDRTSEPDETFRLILTGATAVVFAGAVGVATILDDDAPPTVAVGTGPGMASAVRVYDGTTRRLGEPVPILSHAEFAGGARTAAADVNGDSVLDVIAAAGPGGGSTVVVVDGKTGLEIRRFTAYESTFAGGLFVAAGDMTGDGFAEIVTAPDVGGGGRVRVFDGRTGESLADFMAIDDWAFRGGARVAVGDLTGDGTADLLVGAGFSGGPRVAGFDGLSLRPGAAPARVFNDFFAFAGRDVDTLRNGVYVAVGDLDGDGFGDAIFGGGPGGAPRVRAVSGRVLTSDGTTQAQLANFYAGDERGRGGVRLAARDLDRDGRAEIIAGGGDGERSRVTIYRGSYTRPEGVPLTYDEFEAFPGSLDGVFVG